jgi:hypothetical protein
MWIRNKSTHKRQKTGKDGGNDDGDDDDNDSDDDDDSGRDDFEVRDEI